jgi:hypothetical protein
MIWNFDKNNLIVQSDGDGGDTAQRTGTYYFGLIVRKRLNISNSEFAFKSYFSSCLDLLEKSPGEYVRHPDQWNDTKDFSRDQQTPLVVAMGEFKNERERLKRLFRRHSERFFKYQNADFASPEHIGFYIRAFRYWPLYPFLFGSDFFMLFNSFILIFKGKDPDNVGDDINHTLAILQARISMPTPVSFIARLVYKFLRPKNNGNLKLGESSPIQGAWSWYFRPESGASSFHELYRPIIKEMI